MMCSLSKTDTPSSIINKPDDCILNTDVNPILNANDIIKFLIKILIIFK